MQTEDRSIRQNHACGRLFIGLAAISAVLSWSAVSSKEWRDAVVLLLAVPLFGFIGWIGLTDTSWFPKGGGRGGKSEAGKPVPLRPSPIHHLVAAKDLPPSDKTHSLPMD